MSFGKVALNILGPLSFSISFRIRLISIRKVPGEDYDFDFMEFIDHLQRIESLTTLSLSIHKHSLVYFHLFRSFQISEESIFGLVE